MLTTWETTYQEAGGSWSEGGTGGGMEGQVHEKGEEQGTETKLVEQEAKVE